MVRRVFTVIYKEVRGLHQAAYVLGLFAFGSQLMALVRDRMLAHQFGAGELLDIYYAAFRLPDLMYVLLASTLSVYVLIPFVAKARQKGGEEKARALLSSVFSIFLIVYTVFAVLVFMIAPFLMPKLFPGIVDQAQLVILTQILLLQPFLLGISSLFGVVTQLGHRFVLYAISPLVYNLGIIFGVAVLYPIFGLNGLAYGVVIGAFMHMAIQLPLVQNSSLAFSFTQKHDWGELWEVLKLSVPRAVTLSLNQIVLLCLVGFASIMAVGSVSVFQFAYNLQSVPLAIIGVSYSVAAFPMLAQLYADNKFGAFKTHIITALRHIMFWSIPIVVLIVVLRAHAVRVVLGSGEFDWSDTRLTAAVLAILVISLVAQAANLLMVRSLYAAGRTYVPLVITLGGSVFAVVAAWYFYSFYINHEAFQVSIASAMRLSDVIGSEVLAIALGYTCAVIMQSLLLLLAVNRVLDVDLSWLSAHASRCLCAALVGGFSSYVALNFLVDGVNPDTFVGIFIQGVLSGVIGLAGVILTYAALNTPELREIQGALEKRLFKTDVVAPQEDVL